MVTGLVTVFGGSGFIGRSVVQRLADQGVRVRVAVRRPNEALFLKPMGQVGQIQTMQANLRHRGSIEAAVRGADAVINLVGVLYESGRQTFENIHVDGAATVAEAAAEAGVPALVHMSALGADLKSPSLYARSKAEGEDRVRAAYPQAVILRPSVVFGPDDDFMNRFASLTRFTPVLPLIGGGHTRFQPVYVGDVADAVMRALEQPDTGGQTFELGGPRLYSFREILDGILEGTGRRRLLIPLPFGLARFMAAFFQMLPRPLLTLDQVRLLEQDNVVSADARTIADLGIIPTSLEAIAPTYLARYRRYARQNQVPADL